MLPVTVVLCVAAPFLELAFLVWLLDRARDLVGWPGDLVVLAALVGLSVLGIHMLRHESWVPLQRVREARWRRIAPSRDDLGDALRVTGALLLAVPGFISGAFGLLLRVEAVRDLGVSAYLSAVTARRGAALRRVRREQDGREEAAMLPARMGVAGIATAGEDEARAAPATEGGPLFVDETGRGGLHEAGPDEVSWDSASVAGSTVDRAERSAMEQTFFDAVTMADTPEGDDDRWDLFAPEDDAPLHEADSRWRRRRRSPEAGPDERRRHDA